MSLAFLDVNIFIASAIGLAIMVMSATGMLAGRFLSQCFGRRREHRRPPICRKYPEFRDKIAGADFAGKNLSQKSGAKVDVSRQTFATCRGPESGPLRT